MNTQRKILVVDDEPRLREMTKMILENRGYTVLEAANGLEAVQRVQEEAPDLILLDVMMPKMDGFEACEKIRAFSEKPIIMVTAKGEDYDQVKGLTFGADDYVVKPFTPMVLVARIEAVLRRYAQKNQQSDPEKIAVGEIEIDISAYSVKVCGVTIELKRKEFELLAYLAKNHDISLSRDQILENVWGYDYLGSESTVDTHINRIRNKLGTCSVYLKTVRGYGYKLGASE